MTAASALPAPAGAPPESVIASLGRLASPIDIDRFGASFGLGPARASGALKFRFCFQEVPFAAETERRRERTVLTLTGDFGFLPFSAENARRRRRLRTVLGAARQASGLSWEIGQDHHIRAGGEIDLVPPLTPTTVIAGAATLLLRSRPYLELVIAVGSEP